jgi:hypothetical protein
MLILRHASAPRTSTSLTTSSETRDLLFEHERAEAASVGAAESQRHILQSCIKTWVVRIDGRGAR